MQICGNLSFIILVFFYKHDILLLPFVEFIDLMVNADLQTF